MKEQLRIVTGMLQEVLQRINIGGTTPGIQKPEVLDHSFQDYAALEALEQQLEPVQNQLVIFLFHNICKLY